MKEKETIILTEDGRLLMGKVLLWKVTDGQLEAQVKLTRGNYKEGENIRMIDVLREFDLKKDLCTIQQANGHKKC